MKFAPILTSMTLDDGKWRLAFPLNWSQAEAQATIELRALLAVAHAAWAGRCEPPITKADARTNRALHRLRLVSTRAESPREAKP